MKIIFIAISALFFLFNTTNVFAGSVNHLNPCTSADVCLDSKDRCLPLFSQNGRPVLDENNLPAYVCRVPVANDAFGKIQAPGPLAELLKNDPTGAGAISKFLSNAVTLFFSLAAIVLTFMIIWGAFDWMTSEGDKEKVASARNKIIHAIIGILLFAIAFAVIRMLGQFTGFSFFAGQNSSYHCYSGSTINYGKNPPDCINNADPVNSKPYPAIKCSDNQVFNINKGGCVNR